MMLAFLVLASQAVPALPEHASVDFSGLPSAPSSLQAQTCGVTVIATDDYADVTSTTVYKNRGPIGTATIVIPRRRYGDQRSERPIFNINATWDRKPVTYISKPVFPRAPGSNKLASDAFLYESDLTASVPVSRGGTRVLRIQYRVPLGKCGFDRKQNIVAYWLGGTNPIVALNVAYQYGGHTVFRLPEVHPQAFEWQVGTKGAFIRHSNWTPTGDLTSLTFYPGGFKNIGDGR